MSLELEQHAVYQLLRARNRPFYLFNGLQKPRESYILDMHGTVNHGHCFIFA
jgi:hypothetical protein